MNDDQIINKGGTEHDISEYAKENGADLTKKDFNMKNNKAREEMKENKQLRSQTKAEALVYMFYHQRGSSKAYLEALVDQALAQAEQKGRDEVLKSISVLKCTVGGNKNSEKAFGHISVDKLEHLKNK